MKTKSKASQSKFKSDAICSRCAKPGHELAGCWASNHADGHKLTCPKPTPVPEKYKKAITSINASAKRPDDDEYEDLLEADRTEAESAHWTVIEEDAYWPTNQINMLSNIAIQSEPLPDSGEDLDYVSENELPPLVDSDSDHSDLDSETQEDPEIDVSCDAPAPLDNSQHFLDISEMWTRHELSPEPEELPPSEPVRLIRIPFQLRRVDLFTRHIDLSVAKTIWDVLGRSPQ